MKHFEDIWEEAESLIEEVDNPESIAKIKELLVDIENPETIGKILFELAGISKKYNINVAASLQLAIDNEKIENYG